MPELRVRAIGRLINHRHSGTVPETADAFMYMEQVARAGSGVSLRMWCRGFMPWAKPALIDSVALAAVHRLWPPTADDCARALLVTSEERDALSLQTIGACDRSAAERKDIAKEKKRQADRNRQVEKRRAMGMVDRVSYERESLAQTTPWKGLGMSRSAWYAAGKPGWTSPSRVEEQIENCDTPVQRSVEPFATTARPEPKAAAGGFGGINSPRLDLAEVRDEEAA